MEITTKPRAGVPPSPTFQPAMHKNASNLATIDVTISGSVTRTKQRFICFTNPRLEVLANTYLLV